MVDEGVNDDIDFSIAAFLLVTGFCFLSFTMLLRLLDGIVVLPFLWIGLTTFILGLLTAAALFSGRKKKQVKSS